MPACVLDKRYTDLSHAMNDEVAHELAVAPLRWSKERAKVS